ncbi:response regulator transcription factor [Gloeobacter kilaueensis]|uniref:Two component LuxR family transcriptional regulator n=1 Tax=Gloeobacter kilaueensis (strain ATCC BAA-2537 / CCAP 1431/1 / ULC 316 / JS1) TaxID=1183438 RepID=U5QI08_GLOK1|nr:response regulator transcription factor [Gloeobacter kilaueensis]AGY57259.1 two component LuxR family transcriptional regulator [Gloeobacter kilaueensis JS1]
MIRVLIVAAAAVVRAGLESVIAASPALAVAGRPVSLLQLARQLEELLPDVVLIDLESEADEAALARLPLPVFELDKQIEAPPLVVLVEEATGNWTAEALRAGVRSILPRTATATEIVAAVEAAANRLVTIHPDLIESLIASLPEARSTQASPPADQPLTPREAEVLAMLAEGLGNKTIAKRLTISEHTVKFHISSIFGKLGATSRTEAVTLGVRQGLILL